ncbi:hypothetical protein PUN28_012240 [Cardiocondyla obscurior]|uniref:Uncharacterized protein n=1 Tax=Cardiocondyla obscurior TaxID=286306 RepID=A0AAW2FBF1_9HYME
MHFPFTVPRSGCIIPDSGRRTCDYSRSDGNETRRSYEFQSSAYDCVTSTCEWYPRRKLEKEKESRFSPADSGRPHRGTRGNLAKGPPFPPSRYYACSKLARSRSRYVNDNAQLPQ